MTIAYCSLTLVFSENCKIENSNIVFDYNIILVIIMQYTKLNKFEN